jgi:hypothetical protein
MTEHYYEKTFDVKFRLVKISSLKICLFFDAIVRFNFLHYIDRIMCKGTLLSFYFTLLCQVKMTNEDLKACISEIQAVLVN